MQPPLPRVSICTGVSGLGCAKPLLLPDNLGRFPALARVPAQIWPLRIRIVAEFMHFQL